MAMTKGMKVVAPFVRATSRNGKIHAVRNIGEQAWESAHQTMCKSTDLIADTPIKRFQAMEGGVVCTRCLDRVDLEREERLREKKKVWNHTAYLRRRDAARAGEKVTA